MHCLSDAYRLRDAIRAERAEERALLAGAKAPAAIAHAPSAPAAPKSPAFSFGRILRFPRGLQLIKAR